jgi:SH3 domain protein
VQITSLEEEKSNLIEQVTQLQKKNNELSNKLETFDEDLQMQWFIRGGIIAGVGLLLGLLLPFMPRRKKRSGDRWM